jgi:hypothetical protein
LNRSDYGTGSRSQFIATADFNQDGKLDLVVANYGSNTVGVLLGNGDGTFQTQVSFGVGNGPIAVAARDFNGDGKLDLAVANYNKFSQTNTCGNSVGAAKSCTITVTFKPTAHGGVVRGDVSISDNGGSSPQHVSLSGTGTPISHSGYCEVDSNGNLTGSCVSRSFLCFDIKPSPACPVGQPANQVTFETCSLGMVRVDPTKVCSF